MGTIGLLRYNLRSLVTRRGATALSVMSIGFSVGILVLVLALARGFELSLSRTGRADNLVVLRQGATSEGESGVSRDEARLLRVFPGVATGPSGEPLAAAECYAALNLVKAGGGTANFTLRGVTLDSFAIRDFVEVREGRKFQPGTHEVVVGKSLLGRIQGCRVGGMLELQDQSWPVVGALDSHGGAYDSEIWCDAEMFLQALNREGYQTVILRRASPAPAKGGRDAMIEALQGDKRLGVKAMSEPDYFASQSGLLGSVLQFVGYFIAGIMAMGAAFGTAVTLLASLSERSREIGTLLALGFRPRQVLFGFLVEALLLGLAGGVVGVLLALPVNNVATGTMNWQTWTEQAFAFRITSDVVISAVTFSTLIGVLSGLIPAWKASRVPPSVALRE
jgi:putative ABC transport system permease protein